MDLPSGSQGFRQAEGLLLQLLQLLRLCTGFGVDPGWWQSGVLSAALFKQLPYSPRRNATQQDFNTAISKTHRTATR